MGKSEIASLNYPVLVLFATAVNPAMHACKVYVSETYNQIVTSV